MSPTTRAKAQSTANRADDATAGSKHDLANKEDTKTTKKQKTLEETVENGNTKANTKEEKKDSPSKPKEPQGDDNAKKSRPKSSKSKTESESDGGPKSEGDDQEASKDKSREDDQEDSKDNSTKPTSKNNAKSSGQSTAILEKGKIIFFLRGRVNTTDPSSISEIARTYILLRPLSSSSNNNNKSHHARLLAIPKKTLPRSGRERWISFVESATLTPSDLESDFLSDREYDTKTRGTQHTPAPKPEGEGVYVIVGKGRESHLVYLLTRPKELGEVQTKLGIKERGSWVISTRNPEYAPPPGGVGRLPEGPEFPEEIKKDFHTLRWAPTKPNHLDVKGAQILLVGESSGIEKATEAPDSKEDPKEELQELAEEDEKRMESLAQDDSEAIFADLKVDAEDKLDMQMDF